MSDHISSSVSSHKLSDTALSLAQQAVVVHSSLSGLVTHWSQLVTGLAESSHCAASESETAPRSPVDHGDRGAEEPAEDRYAGIGTLERELSEFRREAGEASNPHRRESMSWQEPFPSLQQEPFPALHLPSLPGTAPTPNATVCG